MPSTIGDRVWFDTDRDGIQDAGEAGAPGVAVSLFNASTNAFVASTTTNSSGAYTFGNLLAGSYYVQVMAPATYGWTLKDQGTDDSADSDIDPATNKTATITLGVAENKTDVDAGLLANQAPEGMADEYAIMHGQQLMVGYDVISPLSLLANDYDPDGDPLTTLLASSPLHGSLQLNSDGTFIYTSQPSYVGLDTFSYRLTDGQLTTGAITVTINVTNQAPSAQDDSLTLVQGYPLNNAPVLGNDVDPGDSLQPIIVATPQHGSVTVNADGTITYTPSGAYVGTDSFTYKVSDGILFSNVATVSLTIGTQHPFAVDDTLEVAQDSWLLGVNLKTNDTIPTSNLLKPIIVAAPQHGAVFVNDDGTISYQPAAGYVGPDSFTYKLNDGVADSNIATVIVNALQEWLGYRQRRA